jgi:1-acyl-sn-glycerol-3-phosphate acyltransferase
MGFARKARAVAVVAALALLFIAGVAPSAIILNASDRIAGRKGAERRRRIAAWQTFWGRTMLRVVTVLMGIRWSLELPKGASGPFIVVSNHLGGFDGFIIAEALHRIGRPDFRSVGKRQVLSWPIVGRMFHEQGWAFVSRSRKPAEDVANIRYCSVLAESDGASVLIFPEGTTYHGPKEGSGLTRVLPPKSSGLRALVEALPRHQVLNLTIRWDVPGSGGSLVDGCVPLGRVVSVDAEAVAGLTAPAVEKWLRAEWQRKDERMLAGAP